MAHVDDPRPLRVLLRTRDGRLKDTGGSGQFVSPEEFRARLQAGERLRVRHESTGADCTLDTVAQVIAAFLPVQRGLFGAPGEQAAP
ncbi:hypothetical protein [Streptomyces sp. NBC_01465]|uniref:hypothetical protein n=1 Tax=Streptomyces sp. NBC_01465 TaxID=2903878 RepID=UPI002E3474FC|nr:hypothetical protein [Streptomyces sp. NBC_01465]